MRAGACAVTCFSTPVAQATGESSCLVKPVCRRRHRRGLQRRYTYAMPYGRSTLPRRPHNLLPPSPWVKQVQRLFVSLLRSAAAEILLCVSDRQGGCFCIASHHHHRCCCIVEGASVAFLEPFWRDTRDAQSCVQTHGRGFRGKRTSAAALSCRNPLARSSTSSCV